MSNTIPTSRAKGTLLLAQAFFTNNFSKLYEWHRYTIQFMVPESGDFILEGIWDKYPDVPAAQREVEYLLDYDPPQKGEDILDVGCGLGGLCFQCLDMFPDISSVTGVDILEEHIAHARERKSSEKSQFFVGDAENLLEHNSDEKFSQIIKRKFHKIYMCELTQDLTAESFSRIFDQCFKSLRINGSILIMTITSKPVKGWFGNLMLDTFVRNTAPKLSDILSLFSKYDCNVTYEDLTEISIKPLFKRGVDNHALAKRMLYWPFSALLLKAAAECFKHIKEGRLSMHIIRVHKTGI